MRVALGVTGGIAAYKSAELVRRLQERGLDVQVIMTAAAREFVTPLTFAALSGRKVITDLFSQEGGEPNLESAIEHIAVAESINALVIAPATADVIAKMAHGIADNFLSTLALATKSPILVAPAMNVNMWENAATRENVALLRRRGVRIIEPDEGYLACGMTGAGRLAGIDSIARAVFEALGLREDLVGENLLVTAGRTEEAIDPVRYISNRSSGKMGCALAEAGVRRGASVTLVSGPTNLAPPSGAVFESVRTADEMAEAVLRHAASATVVVMAAAVADFRPASAAPRKIKRQGRPPVLKFVATRDILREVVGRRKPGQLLVGFAAETEDVLANARTKLKSKHLDLVVANDVTRPDAGFDVDTNVVTLLFAGGREVHLEKMSKFDVANRILDSIIELRSGVAGSRQPARSPNVKSFKRT